MTTMEFLKNIVSLNTYLLSIENSLDPTGYCACMEEWESRHKTIISKARKPDLFLIKFREKAKLFTKIIPFVYVQKCINFLYNIMLYV